MAKFFEYKQVFVLSSREHGKDIVDSKGEVLSSSGAIHFIDVMNNLGRGGWELVGFQIRDDMAEANKAHYNYTSCGCEEYIFKREC